MNALIKCTAFFLALLLCGFAHAQEVIGKNPKHRPGYCEAGEQPEKKYECGAAKTVPSDNDDDPVYKTAIAIAADGRKHGVLRTFYVEHYVASGKVYVRNDQYRDQRYWTTETAKTWSENWSGVSVKDPTSTMVGNIRGDNDNRRILYVERLFRNGRLKTIITSVCRPSPSTTPADPPVTCLKPDGTPESCELRKSEPAHGASITAEGETVEIRGRIEIGDDEKFLNVISPGTKTVYLSSGGGNVSAAVKIGYIVRQKRYATMVPSGKRCGSACVFIWAAGVPRQLDPSGRLYMHCAYNKDTLECNKGLNVRLQHYLEYMGMPQEVITLLATTTAKDDVWIRSDIQGLTTEDDVRQK